MKNYLTYIIKIFLRNIVRIFFIFPLKQDRILFTAFLGEKIADNPKCIFDYLSREYPNKYEYIWVFNGNKTSIALPEATKIVKRFSLRWFYYMATSQVVVDNYRPSFEFPSRKGQYYVETWHAGGAYKKVGGATVHNKWEKKALDKAMNSANVFVSSSRGFTESNIKEGYSYKGKVLNCGMPRNDIFFDKQEVEKASFKVRKYYSLNGLVVLYAPTFRGEVKKSNVISSTINIDQLYEILDNKYDVPVNILVRCHYLDKHEYDFGRHVIDAGSYPDMQEILCATDILITDYSSSMWDYAFLSRPCLLYTPDVDMYIKERGFFTPPEQWPGIICRNMDELCKAVMNLNIADCAEKAHRHLKMMGSYEEGHATEIISNRIVNYINGA